MRIAPADSRGVSLGSMEITMGAMVVLYLVALAADLLQGPETTRRLLGELGLSFWGLDRWKLWSILTAHLAHEPQRIFAALFDFLFLVWFGRPLQARYGSRDCAILVVGAMLLGSGAFLALDEARANLYLGSQALIYAVTVAYVFLHPTQRIYFNFLLPIPLWGLLVIYGLYDLYTLRAAGSLQAVPALGAHLAGALWGVAFHFLPIGIDRWRDWRRRRDWKRKIGWGEPVRDPWVEKHRREP